MQCQRSTQWGCGTILIVSHVMSSCFQNSLLLKTRKSLTQCVRGWIQIRERDTKTRQCGLMQEKTSALFIKKVTAILHYPHKLISLSNQVTTDILEGTCERTPPRPQSSPVMTGWEHKDWSLAPDWADQSGPELSNKLRPSVWGGGGMLDRDLSCAFGRRLFG